MFCDAFGNGFWFGSGVFKSCISALSSTRVLYVLHFIGSKTGTVL